MKQPIRIVLALVAGIAAGSGLTAEPGHDMKPHDAKPVTVPKDSAGHRGEGTVNRVDVRQKKLNLTHGPIESLGWSAMTMDFGVTRAGVLDGVKPGQKIAFELRKGDGGQYLIDRVSPAK